MKVIIYNNEHGWVSVCYPTGELSIEETQAKDTPVGSIIVDSETLPVEPPEQWRLNDDGTITIVPPVAPPEPTKEELLAQLQALTAKIEALA